MGHEDLVAIRRIIFLEIIFRDLWTIGHEHGLWSWTICYQNVRFLITFDDIQWPTRKYFMLRFQGLCYSRGLGG